jgi:hypothetical protein
MYHIKNIRTTYTKCNISYIYALIYDKKPIYIGQTKTLYRRYNEHIRNFKKIKNKKLYLDFYGDCVPSIKIIKICSEYDSDYYELFYIEKCLKKGFILLNNCVKTNDLKIKYNMI